MGFWKKLFGKREKADYQQGMDLAAGQYGAIAAQSEAAATDSMIDGMDKFQDMADRVADKLPHLRRGHLFETIVAAKENAAAARSGEAGRMFVTHLEGHNTAAADLQTRVGDQVVSEAQAKFSVQAPHKIVNMIADPKYHGMDRYIPTNKLGPVQDELERQLKTTADPARARELEDALKHLKDAKTDTLEVKIADTNPTLYAAGNELLSVGREAVVSGAQAAAAAAVVSGAISSIKQGIRVYRGEISADEAVDVVMNDTGKSVKRAGATGSVGALVRYGATKLNVQSLSQSNVATAAAAGLIDIGVTVYDFAKGEVSAEVAMEKIGQSGISTTSSIYAGAAAGAIFGPAGAVIGSMAGYLVATNVYQSCLAVLKDARLAEEEATRVVALCNEACREMKKNRQEFEKAIADRLRQRQREFDQCFSSIDQALNRKQPEAAVEGLTRFARLFGEQLKLTEFKEFDEVMLREGTLRL